MREYSTCRTCNTLLLVADENIPVHPDCELPADLALEQQYRELIRADRWAEAAAVAAVIDAAPPEPDRLAWALRYAGWGWPVFPLVAYGKRPLPGTRGFKDATTDTDRIQGWWGAHPEWNIGVPTGVRFDVIDVDPPEGWRGWLRLVDEDTVDETHGRAITGRGGLHVLVLPTGRGNRAGILPGVDYRGRGGYVVVPPSVTAHGTYRWRQQPSTEVTG